MNFLLLLPCLLVFLGAGGIAFYCLKREKHLRAQLDAAITAKFEAEKSLEVERQRRLDIEARQQNWETMKEESLRAAKASILEAGGQLSSKLLEDHKREQESAKKDQQARLEKTTAQFMEQFTQVTQSVAAIREQSTATQTQANIVWRALANPTGAGQLAEVGLENTLKNCGLESGRDFIIQHSLSDRETGSRLRPDATLFLPQDVVMVIDSKASKYLLELGAAENDGQLAEAREKLKRTMARHLQELASKDYAAAVQEQFRQTGQANRAHTLLNVMYLPSESALQHLREADRDFQSRAEKAGIILCGPTSLQGLCALAKLQIAGARQIENHAHIITAMEQLLESTVTLLGYADDIGKHLKKAADAFNSMGSSVNRRLLPRMDKLVRLGITPPKNKPLPAPIMTYDMRRMDDTTLLEIEAENVLPALERQE